LPEELASQPLASIESSEFARAKRPPPRYQPLVSWSCPDLLSAIYLQFLLLVTNNKPMRLCAFDKCSTPFSPPRKDRKYCSRRCKEQAKEERKRKA
jgi:predicted nucleic acid-binding Zn ribbon protein